MQRNWELTENISKLAEDQFYSFIIDMDFQFGGELQYFQRLSDAIPALHHLTMAIIKMMGQMSNAIQTQFFYVLLNITVNKKGEKMCPLSKVATRNNSVQ